MAEVSGLVLPPPLPPGGTIGVAAASSPFEERSEVDRSVRWYEERGYRVKLAERQAQDILEDARRQARETRLEMEDWADSILSTLEVNLDKFLGAVKRGRERLHERSQETVVAGVGAPGSDNEEPPY
jgi:hypothetical protein